MCTSLNVVFLATDSSSVKVACDQQIGGRLSRCRVYASARGLLS